MSEPYRDPDRDVEARLKDLLGRMTLEEKLAQLACVPAGDLLEESVLDAAANPRLAHGIGHVTGIGAGTGLGPVERARFGNAVQRALVEGTRLGIPAIIQEEALAGCCARGATQYPQAIGLAATWSPESVRAMATAMHRELKAVGARQALAPVLDVARDARWGRLEETYGEDPYLAARLGVAFVRGMQGPDLADGIIATGRHFLGQGLPEGGMNQAPVHLGARELREVFAEPFSACIREAGLRAVMCANSSVDGVAPAGAPEVLDELLREELGFEGLVLADDGAVEGLVGHHGVARDKGAAALAALTAGVDVEMPAQDCFGEPLRTLLDGARAELAVVDRAVRRVLRAKLALGLFERPYVDEDAVAALFDNADSRALASTLAEQSLVLAKNDGVLPLQAGCRLALLGPTADDARLLLGDHHYPVRAEPVYRHQEATTEGDPEDAEAGAAGARAGAYFVDIVTPLRALTERCQVVHAHGCDVSGDDDAGIAEAVAAARDAEVAVVCVGGRSGLMPDCTSGQFRDASDLRLTGLQRRLVAEVAGTGTPVVLVVIGGRAFALETEAALCNAVLMAWLPGEEGGTALARVLLGDASPAGRLPVSLPRAAGQVPTYYNHRAGGGRSAVLGDYSDLSSRPLYPFGHGLSYTTFEYEALSCPDTVDVHATINVWVTVCNSGDRDGDEVVQLYLHDKVADVARPLRRLAGFKRVSLAAGQRRCVKFLLDSSQLGYYDRQMRFVVDPGEVELMVGSSSRDVRLRKTVVLQGERRPLQQQQVVATQVEVTEVEQS